MSSSPGTTGRPKCSLNTHRSSVNNISNCQRWTKIGPGDVVHQFAPLSFDVSVHDYFMCLSHGATLYLGTDTNFLSRFLASNASYVEITPSALAAVDPKEMPKMRNVLPAGEQLLTARKALGVARRLRRQRIRPFGVRCSFRLHEHLCRGRGDRNQQSARDVECAAPRTRAWIGASPAGCAGELCVGGAGLARGYLKRPEKTANSFCLNPYAEGLLYPNDGRLYRTGDLVKLNEAGDVFLYGRMDSQVKLRGQRVELGEIEAATLDFPTVKNASAFVLGGSELILFISPPRCADQRAHREP